VVNQLWGDTDTYQKIPNVGFDVLDGRFRARVAGGQLQRTSSLIGCHGLGKCSHHVPPLAVLMDLKKSLQLKRRNEKRHKDNDNFLCHGMATG
jgi:hypothetical protein